MCAYNYHRLGAGLNSSGPAGTSENSSSDRSSRSIVVVISADVSVDLYVIEVVGVLLLLFQQMCQLTCIKSE